MMNEGIPIGAFDNQNLWGPNPAATLLSNKVWKKKKKRKEKKRKEKKTKKEEKKRKEKKRKEKKRKEKKRKEKKRKEKKRKEKNSPSLSKLPNSHQMTIQKKLKEAYIASTLSSMTTSISQSLGNS